MNFGRTINWLNIPFPHQQIRKDLCADSNQQNNTNFRNYLWSHDFMLDQIATLRNTSFEPTYRRRSIGVKFKVDESSKVKAYADPKIDNVGFISRGLIIAIEDASQSVVSDIRSKFAESYWEKESYERHKQFPEVSWNPEMSDFFDQYRYYDYSFAIDFATKANKIPIGLFHKFVSTSEHRQNIGDLISQLCLLFVSAHEDAHFYRGHIDYFHSELGVSASDVDFFQEFVNKYIDQDKVEERIASELSADSDASCVIVDHFCCDEMFQLNNFLLEHFDPNLINNNFNDENFIREKTKLLLRLSIVAQVIALSIFERNTIKNNSKSDYYPTLGIRILNCIANTTGRINAVAIQHSYRNLAIFSEEEWYNIFVNLYDDIEIVLKYVFEINFALTDYSIEKDSIRKVLDIDINKKVISDFYFYLDLLVIFGGKFENYPIEHHEELSTDLSKYYIIKSLIIILKFLIFFIDITA